MNLLDKLDELMEKQRFACEDTDDDATYFESSWELIKEVPALIRTVRAAAKMAATMECDTTLSGFPVKQLGKSLREELERELL